MKVSFPTPKSAASQLWLAALALGLALMLITALALMHLRNITLDNEARELGLLSFALTGELDRGLQGVQAGLIVLRAELHEGRLQGSGADLERALRTRAALMPLVRSLWLLDSDGSVRCGSTAAAAPGGASFRPALDQLAEGFTAVSRPHLDPRTQESLVSLAVRYAGEPGRAPGWIVAAVPASTLLGAFSAASPATDARMAVFRDDGVRLAGAVVVNPTLDEATLAERLANRNTVELRHYADGSQHLAGLHNLPQFGLKVIVTRDLKAVLGEWREVMALTALGLGLLLAVMALAIHLVLRADRRHSLAQAALQAQISRASKLESLGTLAGAVAHDFNNVLAAIVGYGEMAQDAAPPNSSQARQIARVLQAALRGKSLIERILAFSRGGAHPSTVFELEAVVNEVLGLLATSLRPHVVLERRLDAPRARLRGDPTQVFEAVMNLCNNALQAMPDGGMLTVQLERQTVVASRMLSHSRLEAGDHLVLQVADQGVGIAPEVMEHLFEPFFTTRAAHAGTGLGLAVVHGIVTELGGAIDVKSTPGHGARFALYLPECRDALPAPSAAVQAVPHGAGQTLLVVDDEPALVAMAEEMLTGLGYHPVGFTDPQQALDAVLAEPSRFAAILSDEVMPGLTGTQLCKQANGALAQTLGARAPHIPMLLVSGYGGALLATRAKAAGVTQVLAKPLRRAELAHALAMLLA